MLDEMYVAGLSYPVEQVRVQVFAGGNYAGLWVLSLAVDRNDGGGRAFYQGKWYVLLRNWSCPAINVYRNKDWRMKV